MSGEWLQKCYELKKKVPMCAYVVGEPNCCCDEHFVSSDSGSIGSENYSCDRLQLNELAKYPNANSTSNHKGFSQRRTSVSCVPVRSNMIEESCQASTTGE